jgi:hypothetical protein
LLLRSHRKIRKGVVGIHFYQTDPEFILEAVGKRSIKFIMEPSGVFHPKIYFFEKTRKDWSCLIGSANFTASAFGRNTEALVLIDQKDDPTGSLASGVLDQIDRYWNADAAMYADEVDLESYKRTKDIFKRPLEQAGGVFGPKKGKKALHEVELLNIDWLEFFTAVRRDTHHALDRRIKVLTSAHALFSEYGSLAAMPSDGRKGIAGFIETEDVRWGWFGGMRAPGHFKSLINRDPAMLSAALDEVPLEGPVYREDYASFVTHFKAAFRKRDGEPFGHGLGPATRLLAMKRPDYFICWNKGNSSGIGQALGLRMGRHDYDIYWDSVVEVICQSRWWKSRSPKPEDERAVWRGRTAFLDALYYVP